MWLRARCRNLGTPKKARVVRRAFGWCSVVNRACLSLLTSFARDGVRRNKGTSKDFRKAKTERIFFCREFVLDKKKAGKMPAKDFYFEFGLVARKFFASTP